MTKPIKVKPIKVKPIKVKPIKTKSKRPYPFETADPTVLAWLAGILQAEADFTADKRIRSKSNDSEMQACISHPDYTPPPPAPKVKLEMVEKDLMDRVGELVDQKVKLQNRKTASGKNVYKVTIEAREKTEVFLRAILPYIFGDKNRLRVIELLTFCDGYNKWLAEGGRSKAASLAARSKKKNSSLRNPADSN